MNDHNPSRYHRCVWHSIASHSISVLSIIRVCYMHTYLFVMIVILYSYHYRSMFKTSRHTPRYTDRLSHYHYHQSYSHNRTKQSKNSQIIRIDLQSVTKQRSRGVVLYINYFLHRIIHYYFQTPIHSFCWIKRRNLQTYICTPNGVCIYICSRDLSLEVDFIIFNERSMYLCVVHNWFCLAKF